MIKSLLRAAALVLTVVSGTLGVQVTGVLAAETTGTLSGTVTDASSRPLANVAVSAVSPSMTAKTITGANGFYALTGLAPDTYTVSFTRAGYQTTQQPGITVIQGQTAALSVRMTSEPKVLGTIAVHSASALVQPKTTADTYTVGTQAIESITGTPQNISETALLDALPGITTDIFGYPIIRGSAENEEGYELEGIDATDPITGQFINSLSLAGTSRLVLETGGYDVSAGNTNAGVVNEVIKRGSYPGQGQATATVNAPNFDHRLAFEYGNATPDNRFSYFFAFSGLRQFRVYGDTKTFLPELVGATGDATGDIGTANLFYRWGHDNSNEIEYLGETGASLFDANYGINPAITPYSTNNNLVQFETGGSCVAGGPFGQLCSGGLADLTTFFPGQTAIGQNIGYPDNENNVHTIEKLNYKRQFNPSSFGEFYVTRTIEADIFLFPWGGGAFGDSFEHNVNNNLGVGFDYTNQISSQHQLQLGGGTRYTTAKYDLGEPSFEPFIFFDPNTGGPLLDPSTGKYPLLAGLVNDGLHANNLWIEDTWTPSDRFTVNPGLRWDQEILELPNNVPSQNMSIAFSSFGVTEVPGPVIGTDVAKPEQISPRLAVSYKASDTNVFRASYGKNIEFTPFSNIEFKFAGNPGMASVPFSTPGFSATCVNGIDPQNGNTPCNHITNLYQLATDEFNSFFFAQYTPVRPQRATNVDLSWEHTFSPGLEVKITPYYRKGVDYVVANQPLLFTLSDGTPVFGSPREENAGFNENTGVEFSLQRQATFGWSGFVNLTYDNTLANYDSDFFPGVNNAALALGHVYHVSYLAPLTGDINLNYNSHGGFHAWADFPYESGYRYGVGTHTFVYANQCVPGAPAVPVEVLNTDLAESCLGNSTLSSSYYYTDPSNPGSVLNPHIIGSRGTPDGTDPGTLIGPAVMAMNLTLAHDIGSGASNTLVGVRIENVFGNYTDAVIGSNSRYRNNGFGGSNGSLGFFGPFFGSTPPSGSNRINPLFEPYQYPRSSLPFENEPTGAARTYTFFLSRKF